MFDEVGTAYDFGPWFVPRSWFATATRYVTPESPASLNARALTHLSLAARPAARWIMP
ncbi:MAG TPA: hypothetical protein VL242_21675 [Sorangium sp.]|nr:hypothetical protein [Sorangium sp.]